MPRCPKCMNYVVDKNALLCRIANCGYKRKLKHKRSTFLITLCVSALLHILLVIGLTPTSWWYWHEQIHENTAVTIVVTVIAAVLWYFITLALAGLGWIQSRVPYSSGKVSTIAGLPIRTMSMCTPQIASGAPPAENPMRAKAHFCRVCGVQLASRTEAVTTPADRPHARAVLPS